MLFENINYDILGLKREKELFGPKETLMYGNMFKDEYLPYKDYQVYNIVPRTEKEELLLKIYELDQIINDLNLYLDMHPNEDSYFILFKKYVKDYDSEKEKYEKLYGPLMLNDTDYDKYLWIINPWPWESSGDKYV